MLGQLDGTVYRVDAASEEVTAIPTSDVAVDGGDIAASDGFVWSRTWEGVTVVDAASGRAVARIATEGGSGSVAAADGWLWITDHDHSEVHRVPWPPVPDDQPGRAVRAASTAARATRGRGRRRPG